MTTGEQALKNLQANHSAISVFNRNSGIGANGPVQNQDYPIFQDNLSHYVPWATLKAFVAETLNLSWTQGSFSLPDSGGQTQKMLPSQLTAIAGELHRVEPNTNDFFTKQEHVWEAEAQFFEFVIKEVEARCEETKISYVPINPTLPEGVTEDSQTFGPFVVLTRDSESNKGYKYNNLAGWAFRSLIKTVSLEIVQKTICTREPPPLSYLVAGDITDPPGVGVSAIYGNNYTEVTRLQMNSAPQFDTEAEMIAPENHILWILWARTIDPAFNSITEFTDIDGPGQSPYGYKYITWREFPGSPNAIVLAYYKEGDSTYSISYFLNKSESQVSPCVTTNLGFTNIIGHGRYDLAGAFAQTDEIPEPYTIPDPCAEVPQKSSSVFVGNSVVGNPGSLLALDTIIDGQTLTWSPIQPLVFPPATILLRTGAIAPIYPTIEGAFVYDLFLKKWGKIRQQYKQLLDFSPVNNVSSQVYPHTVFGIQAAMLDSAGKIKIFDEQPTESEIWYGRIGLYRHGMTSAEEFVTQHRAPFTGTVELQASLDGKTIDPSLTQVETFTNQVTSRSTFTAVGRWFIIKIKGIWDLCYAEFRGYRVGKR